ncbi:hypothetical protein Nans01_12610 [Nocardiopsis ansamitocini]|uniref:Uncharacterized protein n=1 Tax=Nocardiopsis ansamitocini TaxID=1670832 RepID=A0A9W6UIC2_9ACTN|nr:hypothetical protein Nans01_12610 [Nocardiopsis ansamitocini]
MAVEDGRHLARATGTARGALTELGARLGSDTYLGHDGTPWCGSSPAATGKHGFYETAPPPYQRESPTYAGKHDLAAPLSSGPRERRDYPTDAGKLIAV